MRHRFQNKIFISFAGLVITLIASASFLVIAHVRNSIVDNVESQIMVTQRVFDTVLEQMSKQAVTQAFSFAESGRFKAAVDTRDPETILQLVETQQAIFESNFIIVTDESGNIIANTLDPGLNKQSVSKNFMIGFPSPSNADLAVYRTKLYETASAPIEIAGYVFGYLIIGHAIDDEKASGFKDITLNEITFFVNDKIAASTLSAEYRGELENYVATDRRERTDSTAFDIHMGEEVFLSRIAPLRNAANSPVGYYVIQKSLTEAYAFLDNVTRILILITAISLLISLALSFFVARGVTAPVNQLMIGANELAKGNYDYEVHVDTRDEIGFLAQSFNDMRISLRNSFFEMEKLNEELRKALQDLKNAQEELIKAERLSTIGSMASSIIHDFKNPMSVIKGYTQLLMRSNLPDAKREQYGRTIVAGVDNMSNMTRDILDFVRGETHISKGRHRLKDLIDEIVSYYSLEIPHEKIIFNVDHGFTDELSIDIGKIKRVFDNLIGNAIQAMGKNGKIEIRTHRDNGHVVIDVADTGKGIPEEIRNRIFEPFVSHGKSEGTGLGLAVSKKIIDDHNGSISVESVPQQGTTFHISLPVQN